MRSSVLLALLMAALVAMATGVLSDPSDVAGSPGPNPFAAAQVDAENVVSAPTAPLSVENPVPAALVEASNPNSESVVSMLEKAEDKKAEAKKPEVKNDKKVKADDKKTKADDKKAKAPAKKDEKAKDKIKAAKAKVVKDAKAKKEKKDAKKEEKKAKKDEKKKDVAKKKKDEKKVKAAAKKAEKKAVKAQDPKSKFNSAFLAEWEAELEAARKRAEAAVTSVDAKKQPKKAVNAAARVVVAQQIARVIAQGKAFLKSAETGKVTMEELRAVSHREMAKQQDAKEKSKAKEAAKPAKAGSIPLPVPKNKKLQPYTKHARNPIHKLKEHAVKSSSSKTDSANKAAEKKDTKVAAVTSKEAKAEKQGHQGEIDAKHEVKKAKKEEEKKKAEVAAKKEAKAAAKAAVAKQSFLESESGAETESESEAEATQGYSDEWLLKTVAVIQKLVSKPQLDKLYLDSKGQPCPNCDPIVYNSDSPLSKEDQRLLRQTHEAVPIDKSTPLLGQRSLDKAELMVHEADELKKSLLDRYPPNESLIQLDTRN